MTESNVLEFAIPGQPPAPIAAEIRRVVSHYESALLALYESVDDKGFDAVFEQDLETGRELTRICELAPDKQLAHAYAEALHAEVLNRVATPERLEQALEFLWPEKMALRQRIEQAQRRQNRTNPLILVESAGG